MIDRGSLGLTLDKLCKGVTSNIGRCLGVCPIQTHCRTPACSALLIWSPTWASLDMKVKSNQQTGEMRELYFIGTGIKYLLFTPPVKIWRLTSPIARWMLQTIKWVSLWLAIQSRGGIWGETFKLLLKHNSQQFRPTMDNSEGCQESEQQTLGSYRSSICARWSNLTQC